MKKIQKLFLILMTVLLTATGMNGCGKAERNDVSFSEIIETSSTTQIEGTTQTVEPEITSEPESSEKSSEEFIEEIFSTMEFLEETTLVQESLVVDETTEESETQESNSRPQPVKTEKPTTVEEKSETVTTSKVEEKSETVASKAETVPVPVPKYVGAVVVQTEGGSLTFSDGETLKVGLQGMQVTLKANVNPDSEFVEFRANGVTIGQSNPCTTTVAVDTGYIAIFRKKVVPPSSNNANSSDKGGQSSNSDKNDKPSQKPESNKPETPKKPQEKKVTVKVIKEGEGEGTFKINGKTTEEVTVKKGAKISLQEDPAENSEFAGWKIGDEFINTDKVYEFKAQKDVTVSACFTKKVHTVKVGTKGQGLVTKDGETAKKEYKVKHGSVLTFDAVPADNHKLSYWTVDGERSLNKTIKVTVEKDMEVQAEFERIEYKLRVAVESQGMGTLQVCDDESSEPLLKRIQNYQYVAIKAGSQVTVKANPEDGHTIQYWQVNGKKVETGTKSYSFKAMSDMDIVAVFEEEAKTAENTFSFTIIGEGTVTDSDGNEVNKAMTVPEGESPVFTANPENGWQFEKFVINDEETEMNPIEVKSDSSKIIVIVFQKIPEKEEKEEVTFTVKIKGGEGFAKIDGLKQNSKRVLPGTETTAEVFPNEGYRFVRWEEIPETENPYTTKVEKDLTLTAILEKDTAVKEYTFPVISIGKGEVLYKGEPVKKVTLSEGEIGTLEAKPEEGWSFGGFIVNVEHVTQNPIEVEANVTKLIVAVFTENTVIPEEVTFTVKIKGGEGFAKIDGLKQNSKRVLPGTETTAEVVPEEGYVFARWEGIPEAANPYTVKVDKDLTLTAVLEKDTAVKSSIVVVTKTGKGEITTNGQVVEEVSLPVGSSAEFEANPEDGWVFKEFIVNGKHESGNPLTFEIPNTVTTTVVGIFTEDTEKEYTATVTKTVDGGDVTINGENISKKTVKTGNTLTFRTKVKEGYALEGYKVNGSEELIAKNPLELKITQDTSIEPIFSEVEKVTLTILKKDGGEGEVYVGENKLDFDASGKATISLLPGTHKLRAAAAEGSDFVSWTNENGRVLKESADYSLTVASNETLCVNFAKRTEETTIKVSYVINDVVVKSDVIKAGETLEPYGSVVLTGQTFKGWLLKEEGKLYAGTANDKEFLCEEESLTAAIARRIAEGKDTTFVASYEKEDLYKSLEIIGGKVISYRNGESKEINGKTVYQYGTQITVNLLDDYIPEGNQFNYWQMDGIDNPVTYEEEYIFTITKDTVLRAKYSKEEVEKVPVITMASCELNVEKKSISIHIDCDIPDTYSKLEWGYLFNKTGISDEEFLYTEPKDPNVVIKKDNDERTATALYAGVDFTPGVSSVISAKQTMKFRGYAKLLKDGKPSVIYTPIVTFTPDDYTEDETEISTEEGTDVNVAVEEESSSVEETTEEETPSVEETTEEETPSVEETTEEETPSVEETTEEETPSVEETTEEETPSVEETTEEETPSVEETTEEETPSVEETTEEETSTVEETTEEETTNAEESAEEETSSIESSTEEKDC